VRYSKYSCRSVSLLVFLPMLLTGQNTQAVVPLKNWATPLYWQPNQAERETAAKAAPQLMFSSNAVSTNALTFVAITPCRLMDTRGLAANFGTGGNPAAGPGTNSFAPGQIPSQGTLTIEVQSAAEQAITAPAPCGAIPSIAQAYSFNLTVVPAGATASSAGGAVDYVTLWPAGSGQPFVSTLDDVQGLIVSNAAIVPAGTPDGGVSVYSHGPSATNVIIDMNGYYAAPTDGFSNTAVGTGTLASNTTGYQNTASGASALANNTTGSGNTAVGGSALQANTTGNGNTASGLESLQYNTTGGGNTASGAQALLSNTTGSDNTATGGLAMQSNTTGINNTASGYQALQSNAGGWYNTAVGSGALQNNVGGYVLGQVYPNGSDNTAIGWLALAGNINASGSTAVGADALYASAGEDNTAIGAAALEENTTGAHNIAVGNAAALNVTTGSYNIEIGSQGVSTDGAASNSGVIRIGTVGTQTSTYIAGIWGNTPNATNLLVCVDANGTLGTLGCSSGTPSSRRFKEQITDMGDRSSKLFQLRPVTFFYKPEYDDGSHTLQYGLIAEEVAKLYPDMVGYDKDGQPNSVKYQSLGPMLLNELQKQHQEMEETIRLQNDRIAQQDARLVALEALLASKTRASAGGDQ
jgi:hypothetical protein